MAFSVEGFIADCQAALDSSDPVAEVQALVTQAVANPDALRDALPTTTGEPSRVLHRADDLTVLQVTLPPGLKSPVHNHTIWAVIGIYEGREDNRFFTDEAQLEQCGERSLGVGDVAVLDETAIHAIANPLDAATLGLHVYGGDLLDAPRDVWDPDTGRREPFTQERFAEFSRRVNA
jgi:predicted metal-dependent enzyme (double-stranded beta helix superfamily)